MITLKEFCEKEHKHIDNFLIYWERKNKLQPDNYPLELASEDWFENFICYLDDTSS